MALSETQAPEIVGVRGKHPAEDLLYERIVDAIIDKSLRPGQHLNEVKLAASFSVPRSRVRRVLERLRDEDIVELQLHRGAFISRPTVEEALNVFEARRYLEAGIAELACARATPADIERLRDHLTLQRDVFDNLRPEMNRVAGEFHVLLAGIAGNAVLSRMLNLLIRRVCLIQSLYEQRSGVLCLVHEHERLVDLIAANDREGAADEARHHCDHILESLDLTERRRSEIDLYELQ